MKLLLIHHAFLEKNDGGGSRFNEMTRIWAEQGHSITVLAGMVHYTTGKKPLKYKGKYFVKEAYHPNITVIRSHVSEAYNVNFLGRLWGYFSFVFSSLYSGVFLSGRGFDCIIVTSPPLFVGITGWLLSKIKRIPFVFEVRDLWPESAIDTGVVNNKVIIKAAYRLEAFLYKKARLINVLTPAFKKVLIEKKNVSDKKIIFIPNAADFSISDLLQKDFDPKAFRESLNIRDELMITYVGAHGVANHLWQILDAAELLRNEKVVFFLIGDGMEKNKLITFAKEKGLENIRFIDSVPKSEVFKYIMASDIGTSVLKKVDTFKTVYSNKTFDYMSCRKPVIMAIDGVSRELIEDSGSGMYVEPENPLMYAESVRYYLNNKHECKVHGENGYLFAKKHFDREVLANSYLKEIENILN